MRNSKKLYVSVIVIIILALSVCFMLLDFSRFLTLNYSYDIFPSAILKRICVILAAAIAWSVGRDGLTPPDSRLINAAFLFACFGEIAFVYKSRAFGIFMFCLCQLLLTIRNGAGLRGRLEYAGFIKKLGLSALFFFLVHLVIVFVRVFGTLSKPDLTSLIVCFYAAVLSISLWTSLACAVLALLPAVNSRLAAAGVCCFFCCDILVGLDAVLEAGVPWLLANSFIWIFYIPALVMLALSSYSYD